MNRWYVIAIPLLALGATLGACGGSDSKTVDVPGGGKISVSDKLPDGFPDDFPMYDGAKVVSSYSGEQDGQQGSYVLLEADDSVDDVKDFYTSELESGPWTSTGNFSSSGTSVISAENKSGDKAAAISIGEADGKTTISIFLGDNPDGSSGDGDSGNDEENTPDDSDPSDEETPSGDDSGSDDNSSSADLPDEASLEDAYPKDKIPLPSGARVTNSSAVTSGGSSFVSVELYSKKTVDELKDFYKDAMENAGYTESVSSSSGGETFLSYTEGDGSSGNAAIVSITKSDVAGYNIVSISLTGTDSE